MNFRRTRNRHPASRIPYPVSRIPYHLSFFVIRYSGFVISVGCRLFNIGYASPLHNSTTPVLSLFSIPLGRFERPTPGLGNRCSILLSYRG